MVEILLAPVVVLGGGVVPVFRALVIACYDGMGRDADGEVDGLLVFVFFMISENFLMWSPD